MHFGGTHSIHSNEILVQISTKQSVFVLFCFAFCFVLLAVIIHGKKKVEALLITKDSFKM